MEFLFNDCDVCINPEIVFFKIKEGALAWDYVNIKIAFFDGVWISGYTSCGGGSPVSKRGKSFKDKEDAINDVYDQVKRILESGQGMSNNSLYYLDFLLKWYAGKSQLTLNLF